MDATHSNSVATNVTKHHPVCRIFLTGSIYINSKQQTKRRRMFETEPTRLKSSDCCILYEIEFTKNGGTTIWRTFVSIFPLSAGLVPSYTSMTVCFCGEQMASVHSRHVVGFKISNWHACIESIRMNKGNYFDRSFPVRPIVEARYYNVDVSYDAKQLPQHNRLSFCLIAK